MEDKSRKPGDDLADRLLDFAARIISLTNTLQKTATGKHVGCQLLRAGTSSGANYEEARGAESRADFIHKLGIVLKELKESRYWLHLICRARIVDQKRLESLINENQELIAIIAKSIVTAKNKRL
jgi:four helix bundle protein